LDYQLGHFAKLGEDPVYFVSKVLQGTETRYQAIEKAALAVVFIAQWLHHYFQSFTVIIMIDLPIRKVLQKLDIASRMVRWAVELSEFDIHYEPRGPIKGQVYVDFMIELSSKESQPNPNNFQWVLSMDGSSNQQRSETRVILEGPNGILIEQALKFAFKTSNNQAEYEALIVGMLLAKELGAQSLLVKSDSVLVIGQVTGDYQAKDPQLALYLRYVRVLRAVFSTFDLVHVPREQNSRADLLSKLASSGKGGMQRLVVQETLKSPRTAAKRLSEVDHLEVLKISPEKGRKHQSMIQETLKVPRITIH